jgi:hypothetical protein
MLIASHLVVGGVLGDFVGTPATAFVFGLVSHYALDVIPHYDITDDGVFTKRQITLLAVDGFIGVVVLVLMINRAGNYPCLLWGAFGGILPDLLNYIPKLKDKLNKLPILKQHYAFHKFVQHIYKRKVGPVYGLAVQYAIIVVMLVLFFKFG